MAFLVRFVGARTAWPPQPGADPIRGLADFKLRPAEVGLSVWRVTSSQKRDLVIVERACQRQRVEPIDFIEVDEERVRAFGEVISAPVPTIIRCLGAHHCELRWSQDKLIQLANDLLAAGTCATRVKANEVRRLLQVLDDGEVDPTDLQLLARLRR